MSNPPPHEVLLTPSEVAHMFRVDPKTVTRWAKAGKLTSLRTLGGHRRYLEIEVNRLLTGDPATVGPAAQAPAVPPTVPPAQPAVTQASMPGIRDWRPGITGHTVSLEPSPEGATIVERRNGQLLHIITTTGNVVASDDLGDVASQLAVTLGATYLGPLK